MGFSLISYPQVVYRQATAPTGVNSGALWLDTGTNDLYYYNGSSWTLLNVTLGDINTSILENTLGILEIQAADTITSGTSASMTRDIFSDSGGYLNTIDTGNTTAGFSVNKYTNPDYTATTNEAHGYTSFSSETYSNKCGGKITMGGTAKILISLTKDASCDATKGYLLDSSKATIASASFSGNVATFSTPQSLSSGTTYYFAVDKDGSAYTNRRQTGAASYPIAGTALNWVTSLFDGSDNATAWVSSIVSAQLWNGTSGADKIIQTNEQTLSFTPSYFQVFAYKKSITGTSDITADVTFDSGAHYQTGVALDSATAITNAGTGLIVKINLVDGASHNLAECSGFGIMYW